MNIGVSTLLFGSWDIVAAASEIAAMGHQRIELFCQLPGFNPDEVTETTIKRLLELARQYGLKYSVHPPVVNTAASDDDERAGAVHAYTAALEVAARLGAGDVVVHSGHRSNPGVQAGEAWELAEQTLRVVGARAADLGVRLLLENTGWHAYGFMETPADLLRLADVACPQDTGLLLDTGHAVLQGFDPAETARLWLPRLAQIHAHDNGGNTDDHLPLGRGVIDWASLISTLIESRWDGVFMIEVGENSNGRQSLAQSMRIIERHVGR